MENDDVRVADEGRDVTVSKTFTPLFVVSKPYCVRAYTKTSAELLIEHLGEGAIKRREVLADEWRVMNTNLADPTICGIGKDQLSRAQMWGKYNRMKRLLKECPSSDFTCIKRRTTFLNKYGNQLRTEPKQCYCGEFEFHQSILTRNRWLMDMGIPVPGGDEDGI